MKNISLSAFLSLFLVLSAYANDGSFYVSGSTLLPLQETQVSLRKEMLKFYVRDFNWMDVSVDFEFYNPGAAKTVTVGFVTPPADGDVSENEQEHPQIKDFTVMVNGQKLSYQMKRMKDTSFSADKLEISGTDFVYYFKVRFGKGINKIRHTYRFRGGGGVEMMRDFDYQITTGKRWANKQIDDFELQLHLDNGIFSLPATFREDGKLAAWKIIGDGMLAKEPRYSFGEDSPKIRFAHLNSGYISLKEKNFRPDFDIMLGEYNWGAMWSHLWCLPKEECAEKESLEKIAGYLRVKPFVDARDSEFEDFSKKELKYIRNYFFAVRGLTFKDAEVKKFYSQFFWYKPDAALKAESIKFSASENAFLAKVKRFENKK